MYEDLPPVPQSIPQFAQGWIAALDRKTQALANWDPQGGRNLFAEGFAKIKDSGASLVAKLTPEPSAAPTVQKSPEIEAPQIAKAPSMGHDVQQAVAKVDLSGIKDFGASFGGLTAANEVGFQNLSFAQARGSQSMGLG